MVAGKIDIDDVIQIVDKAVFQKTGKHLAPDEIKILTGTWEGQDYKQISENCSYSESYIRRSLGPTLWKRLTEALGEDISKRNFRDFSKRQLLSQKLPNIEMKVRQEKAVLKPRQTVENPKFDDSLVENVSQILGEILANTQNNHNRMLIKPNKLDKLKFLSTSIGIHNQIHAGKPSKADTAPSSSTATSNEVETPNECI